MSDDFYWYNEHSKHIRNRKLDIAEETVPAWCEANGVNLKIIQDYQFRLSKGEKVIDIFPKGSKWHDIKQNKRGTYLGLIPFLQTYFK